LFTKGCHQALTNQFSIQEEIKCSLLPKNLKIKINRTAHPVFLVDKIKKSEMGRACSVYGGEERHIQGFGGET